MPRKKIKRSTLAALAISSWAWLAVAFGALTWLASHSDLIGWLDFVDRLTRYWRDITRDLWEAFFAYWRLPYSFSPAQRDTLTILVVSVGVICRVYLLKPSPKPLFKTPILASTSNPRDFWVTMGTGMFGSVIVTLFFYPFVDTKYYALGGTFWTMVFGGFATIAFWFYFGWKALEAHRDPVAAGEELRKRLGYVGGRTKWLRFIDRGFWLASKLVIGLIVAPWMFWDNWQRLHSEGYWSAFTVDDFVDILLLVALGIGVIAVVARTLVPIFRIVVLGIVLALLGLSAGQLRLTYEKYFGPADQTAISVSD